MRPHSASSVSARVATDGDLSELVRLDQVAREQILPSRGGEVFLLRRPGRDEVRRRLLEGIEDPEKLVLIGLIRDSVVGFGVAELVVLDSEYRLAEISGFFVEPDAREVGVGQAIIEEIIRWAADNACDGIDSVALPGDRSTKNFFESQGMVARAILVHRDLRK